MRELMLDILNSDSYWIENKRMTSSSKPIGDKKYLTFQEGNAPALQISLPESYFIHEFYNVKTCKTYLSFKPNVLTHVSYYFFYILPTPPKAIKNILSHILTFFLYLIRGLMFRRSKTDIQLICTTEQGKVSGIYLNDAFLSASLFTMAISTLLQKTTNHKGIYTVEELFSLEQTLALMKELGGEHFRYKVFPNSI